MNAYDNNLYEFLTREENFEPFIDMFNQYQKVRKRLLTDFWSEVQNNLNAENKTEFKVYFECDVMEQYSNMGFYHEMYLNGDDSTFTINFEKLSEEVRYGLWFNRNEKVQKVNFPEVCEIIKKEHKGWKPGTGGWWFAAYRFTGDNFKNPETLVKLLPQNRDEMVKEYGGYLRTALTELAPVGYKYAQKLSLKK